MSCTILDPRSKNSRIVDISSRSISGRSLNRSNDETKDKVNLKYFTSQLDEIPGPTNPLTEGQSGVLR